MKKNMFKFTAIFVVLTLILSSSSIAFASEANLSTASTILELGDTRIDTSTDSEGNTVLLQYTDGILTVRSTLYSDKNNTIKEEFFGPEYSCKYLSANDYITGSSTSAAPYASYDSGSGNIYFRTPTSNGYHYYNMNCSYTSTSLGQSTYTINDWIGPLSTLVLLFVPYLGIGEAILGVYISGLLQALGIIVINGTLSAALSITLAAIKTRYNWTLADSNSPSEKRYTTGYKYIINDSNAAYSNKVYYDGNVPQQWGNSSMAARLHGMMYAYMQWETLRWGPLS